MARTGRGKRMGGFTIQQTPGKNLLGNFQRTRPKSVSESGNFQKKNLQKEKGKNDTSHRQPGLKGDSVLGKK